MEAVKRSFIKLRRNRLALLIVILFSGVVVLWIKKRFAYEEEMAYSAARQDNSPVNALIVGGEYCGTNPLAAFLSLHPNIAVTLGQIRFFTDNYDKGVEWYTSMLSKPNQDQYVKIERSPGYLYSDEAPPRAKKLNPSIKIIIILRNPVNRLVTDYSTGYLPRLSEVERNASTFEKYAKDSFTKLTDVDNEGVKKSLYHPFVLLWLNEFPRNQIHIIDGEQFIKNPLKELKSLETFLAVPHVLSEANMYHNTTSGYKCPVYGGEPYCYGHSVKSQHLTDKDSTVLGELKDFYSIHNKKLFSVIGETFYWD